MLAHYQRDSERPQLIDISWQLAPAILSWAERISRNIRSGFELDASGDRQYR
jgi:hypothetical protein